MLKQMYLQESDNFDDTGKNSFLVNSLTSTVIYLKIFLQICVILYVVYDGMKRKKVG